MTSFLSAIGAFHLTDVLAVFGLLPGRRTEEYQARWIAFANTMDPNVEGYAHWPNYGEEKALLLIGAHGSTGTTTDDYREEAMAYLNDRASTLSLTPR